jgi:acyl-CoA synthetase (AMP-forming)/AMP-acid ligase II
MCTNPENSVADFSMLRAEEVDTILYGFNASTHSTLSQRDGGEPTAFTSALRAFEAVAETQEDCVAVLEEGGYMLTYGEVNRVANRLARRLTLLVSQGGCETLNVMCVMGRSADFVVASLAILKMGGKVVPVDPVESRVNPELVNNVFEDCKASLVLVESSWKELVSLVPVENTLVLEGRVADQLVEEMDANLDFEMREDDIAYGMYLEPFDHFFLKFTLFLALYRRDIYGMPSFSVRTHQNLVADSKWSKATGAEVYPSDRVVFSSSTSSLYALLELWSGLTTGCTVLIMRRETKVNQQKFLQFLVSARVTVLYVSSLYS